MTASILTGNVPTAQREELRGFLRSRRARLSPDDVGLPVAGRRRTPGLRREEVAVLAGVGVSWYTWLEQGRDIKVSDSVLDAISRALRLEDFERAHLYRLAGLNPPPTAGTADPSTIPRLQRIVDEWQRAPAYVIDRYWNILVSNASARCIFALTSADHNCLITFFTNPRSRARYPSADEVAADLVAQFRAEAARFPGNPQYARIVNRLAESSPDFAVLWARYEVRGNPPGTKRIEHPDVGLMCFEHTTLSLPERADLRLMLYLPQAGTDTSHKLEQLSLSRGREDAA